MALDHKAKFFGLCLGIEDCGMPQQGVREVNISSEFTITPKKHCMLPKYFTFGLETVWFAALSCNYLSYQCIS